MATIIPVGPTVRIIVPPTDSIFRVVTLSEPLASEVRAHYAKLVDDHARFRFKPVSFDEWVEGVFADAVRGRWAIGDVAPGAGEVR